MDSTVPQKKFILLESFGISDKKKTETNESSESIRSGILVYEYSTGKSHTTYLIIRGAGSEDIVGYFSQFSPEIYEKLKTCMDRGSLHLDIETNEAWQSERKDTSPETAALLEAISTVSVFPEISEGFDYSSTVSIVLCGGRGTRMQSKDLHKVCFPIAGRPAINRLLDQLESAGIHNHIIVVGEKGRQVVEEVTEIRDNVTFVYQINQNGTGNAAKQAAYFLEAQKFRGDILVIPGDKVLESTALRRLLKEFKKQNANLAFMTADKEFWPDSGRVVTDPDGRPVDIVEKSEIMKMILSQRLIGMMENVSKIPSQKILREIKKDITSIEKARTMFPKLFDLIEHCHYISAEDMKNVLPETITFYSLNYRGKTKKFCGEELESATTVSNAAVYLFHSGAFNNAIFAVNSDNAQNEEYLTDVVSILASDNSGKWKIITVPTKNYHEVMAFNNPEELLKIEDYYNSKESGTLSRSCFPAAGLEGTVHPVGEWLKMLEDFPPNVKKRFADIYGDSDDIINERREAYIHTIEKFIKVYGNNNDVIIVRSPGRVNLMGRHIEHRGGYTNYITINREMLLVAGMRGDDIIDIHNIDSKNFRPRRFSIGDEIAQLPWDEWLTMINSETVLNMIRASQGDWSNYFKASALRLQEKCKDHMLNGFNGVLSGQIPLAAGLSSSSAVVVSAAEALTNINGLSFIHKDFVDLCGEGEWFVGTRGGSGDHAAMKYGQKNNILHMGFFEVRVEDVIPFPDGCRLMVLQSHQYARKSAGAMQIFNEKVATYEIAHELIKYRYPHFKERLNYFRDINTEHLGLKQYEIYDILLSVPERITREELMAFLDTDARKRMERVFSTHHEPEGGYQVRSVALYGLAEIARAREFARLIKNGHIKEAAQIMNISHDGDRVTQLDRNGKRVPYNNETSDRYIRTLRKNLKKGDRSAELYCQPGGYGCSTVMIDEMIDTALSDNGVLGAQLSGAGLGGCIMALVKNEYVDRFTSHMTKQFYEKHGLNPQIYLTTPIAGSGIVTL
ncbi:sugar phosphate nucleotidyltransferase [Candidatus Latescibacterota bacterium]